MKRATERFSIVALFNDFSTDKGANAMKVKDHPALLKAVHNPDLNLPSDAGEMEVEELVAWAKAAGDDCEAELQKTEGQLAIAEEIAFLTSEFYERHPGLPLSELIGLMPEPRRSLVIELIRQMPKQIQIR